MRFLKIFGLVLLGLFVLSYFLFKPVFTQFMGWKAWPLIVDPPMEIAASYPSEEAWQDVSNFLDGLYSSGNYPSLSVAVWYDGEVRWAKVIGYSDLDERTPAGLDTQYRIGSSSKAVNATLAAVLVDEGALNLDAPISNYVTYFPDKGTPITTRQLLSHTAGIRHYGTCLCFPIWDYENTRKFDSVERAVATFSGSPLLFEPATDFSYSTYGIVLSSGVLEVAGDAPYLDLIADRISTPLGLSGLMPDRPKLEDDRRAHFYDVYEENYKTSEFIDSSIKWAGGGFVASPTDLAALGGAWLNNDFISEEVQDIFWTPQKLADGEENPQFYALGWRRQMSTSIVDDGTPILVVHHNGTGRGASSNFVLFPDHKIVVSVMTNRSTRQGDDPFRSIASKVGSILIEARNTEADE